MPLREVQKLQRDSGAATSIMVKFDGPPGDYLIKRIYNIPSGRLDGIDSRHTQSAG